MDLYALKSEEGYLKITPEDTYTLVSINKASVYQEDMLKKLKKLKKIWSNELKDLRIVKMILTEEDYFG
ncbi:MAG: hypothetical protein RR310_06750 [Eubacterium sp.]